MPLSQVSSRLSDPIITALGVLLPHLAGTVVEKAELAGRRLCIWARSRAEQASCPACGRFSVRVHSRYQRRLADAAIGGRQVLIRLRVRRFFCPAPDCPVITFAEQVEGLTVRYARRTPLLAEMLTAVALALAGRAGTRLACLLGLLAGRSSMLRLIMALPDPQARPVPVLGAGRLRVPPRPHLRHAAGQHRYRQARRPCSLTGRPVPWRPGCARIPAPR
jgi:hypothetical protein